jgi:DNA-binding winged helix-turn-helix (wHTH) protein
MDMTLAQLANVLETDVADLDSARPSEIRFRGYRLLPGARILLRGPARVELGGRAFDLLEALLERRGSVVSKQELLDRVWPNTFIEESNLRFQMAVLRRALGDDGELIKTVPRRGYLFAEELAAVADAPQPSTPPAASPQAHDKLDLLSLLHMLIDELARRCAEDPCGAGPPVSLSAQA